MSKSNLTRQGTKWLGRQLAAGVLCLFSFLVVAQVPQSLDEAQNLYYKSLDNDQLSRSQKDQQWELIYQFLQNQSNSNFNLKVLTLYQLAASAANAKHEIKFNRWLSELKALDSLEQQSIGQYLLKKLAQDWAYSQNDFATVFDIGQALLSMNVETVHGHQSVSSESELKLPTHVRRDVINTLGRAYYRTGDYIKAQQSFIDTLKVSESMDDKQGMSHALNNLSVIAWSQNDIEKALEYLDKGLQISIELGDVKSIISKWSNKGIYHNRLEEFDKAEKAFESALNHPNIDEYPKLKSNSLLALSELNSQKKNYSLSKSLAQQALQISLNMDDQYSINSAKMVVAGLANKLQEFKEAEQLYLSALKYFTDNQLVKEQSTALLNLSESYRYLNRPEKALAYFQQYHEVYAELQKGDKNRAVASLQEEFEAESRKKEIEMLKQENQIKAIQVATANSDKDELIVYGIAGLLILLLIVSRYYSFLEAKRLQQHAKEIEAREKELLLLSIAFKSTSDAVWISDSEFRIEVVNASFHRLTERMDPVGRKMIFAEVMGQDRKLTDSVRAQVREQGSWQGEAFDQKVSGEIYPIEIKIESIKNDKGEIIHFLGAFRDITNRKNAEEQLKRHVTHDELTGLPNRVMFSQLIERSFLNVKREKVIPVVLFVDVDGFKKLNDSLGHDAGDHFICNIAKRLTDTLRTKDVVARIGGDEFGVLVELGGNNVEAASVAKKLLNAFVEPFDYQGKSFKITVSIGVAVYPNDAEESEELIRKSDIAMNAAKQLGKNTFSFYEGHMNDEVVALLEQEQRIVNAIDSQLFEFFYQPIVDVNRGAIVGAEALIRWREPDGTLVFPDQFIPLAERSGIIEQIDVIVVDKVFKQVAQWNATNIKLKHISINLSARIFSQADKLLSLLENKLSKYQISASQVKIEITEGMLVHNVEEVIKTMLRLKQLGFILAIDDFGTGFSSLNYLKQFPVDILKIDRSFIMDMHESPKNKSIVRTIVELAHNLDFNVIAEGVEHKSHLSTLSELGCEEYQGYYFSKPLEIADFESLYSQNINQ